MQVSAAAGVEVLGYLGALFTFGAYSMRTMMPLRMAGIAANSAFILYGALAPVYPTLLLHVVLLPLNVIRLRQTVRLGQQVRNASRGDLSVEWLQPFTRRRRYEAGQRLWHRGEAADELLFLLGGRFRAVEAGIELGAGDVIGELGLLSPEQRRTQTVECFEAGEALTISYDEVRQLAFQNPKFGFYFLQLSGRRLQRDVQRLESALAQARAAALPG